MNIRNILLESTARDPGKEFVIFRDDKLTYGEFSEKVNRLANSLRQLDILPAQKISLLMYNSIEYLVSYFAIASVGATAVPLNFAFTAHEIAYHLNDSDSVAVISDNNLLPKVKKAEPEVPGLKHIITAGPGEKLNLPGLIEAGSPREEIASRRPEDVMHLIYTSGTTGFPKGAMITHGNIAWMVETLNKFYGEKPDDLFVSALPLFHAYGKLQSFLSPVNIGATIILLERFDPEEVMKTIHEQKATVFFGVPTMYNLMVNSPNVESYDLTSLRICVSGGASLPVEVLISFKQKADVSIAEGYGLSETTVLTHCNPLHGLQKAGSIGPTIPGVEAKVFSEEDEELPIGEVGELVVKGPNIMKGYYQKEKETEEAMRQGWLHTGDLVKKDQDNYYYVVDRIKDMYIRGGRNVYPREIEEVLFAHPKVSEAAVIGIPDEKYGEQGKAFVVLSQGVQASEEEIMNYLGERVAKYKLPQSLQFVEELPKNTVGKVLKRELRASYMQ